jgi:hypothetical protein
MNGIIYNKKTIDTPQGTGDKCLILGPRTSYQLPFTFGADWEIIRLGVIWSCSSTTGENTNDDTLYNTPITDTTDGESGTLIFESSQFSYYYTPKDKNSWYGITKNNNLNTFPNDNGTTTFMGWQGNSIHFSSDVGDVAREYGNHLRAQSSSTVAALTHWERTRIRTLKSVSTSSALPKGSSYSDVSIAPKLYGLKNSSSSGISPEAEENFASFWGLQIEKFISQGKYYYNIMPCYLNESMTTLINGGGNHQYSSGCKISDCSESKLLNIINGNDLQSGIYSNGRYRAVSFYPTMNITTDEAKLEEFNQAYSPNSSFFYNAFDDLNIRIHSHAVVKIK